LHTIDSQTNYTFIRFYPHHKTSENRTATLSRSTYHATIPPCRKNDLSGLKFPLKNRRSQSTPRKCQPPPWASAAPNVTGWTMRPRPSVFAVATATIWIAKWLRALRAWALSCRRA